MARIKYYYDTETCKYERVKISAWEVLLNFLGLFIVTLLLAAGLVFLYIKVFPNKKVALMKEQNKHLTLHRDSIQTKIVETSNYLNYIQGKDKKLYKAITGSKFQSKSGTIANHKYYLDQLKSGTDNTELISEKIKQIDRVREKSQAHIDTYASYIYKYKSRINELSSIPAIQPIKNSKFKRLASGFGQRTHPLYKVRVKHEGIDFSAPEGTPVYATGDGTISMAKKNHKGEGTYIEIEHNDDFKTTYSHLQKFIVKEGQTVKRGDIIGYVGSTGKALSSHLGYEIIFQEQRVNPVHYFFMDTNSRSWHILLELSQLDNQTLS